MKRLIAAIPDYNKVVVGICVLWTLVWRRFVRNALCSMNG